MNKRIWRIEYSLTIFAVFIAILFMIPTSFSSKTAVYISTWNSEFNKIAYMFTAMTAQANSDDITQNMQNAKTDNQRERYMIKLVKSYLRLEERLNKKKYVQHYMNGKVVSKKDFYYFDTLYNNQDGLIIGIKDIVDTSYDRPVFMMLIDANGIKKPNTWGIDIFGLNIYKDGNVTPIGYGWDVDKLRKDCSKKGTGLSCSQFYRIGGEFVE